MTWKIMFVQLLLINILVCKVFRVAECATVINATESEGNKTAEGAVVTKTTKHKGVPLKVFVTEIDASKFFKNRNTCSVVYCFWPRDIKQEKLDIEEEKKERHEEERHRKAERRAELREQAASHLQEVRERKAERRAELREQAESHRQEVLEHKAERRAENRETREAHREAARQRWNQRLEELKQ